MSTTQSRPLLAFLWIAISAGLYPLVFWPLERASVHAASDAAHHRLHGLYSVISLEHFFPEMLDVLPPGSLPRWAISLLPAALVMGLIIAITIYLIVQTVQKILFRKKLQSMVDDPEFGLRHGTISTPSLNHSNALHASLPEKVGRKFRLARLAGDFESPVIPAIPANPVDDSPTNLHQKT